MNSDIERFIKYNKNKGIFILIFGIFFAAISVYALTAAVTISSLLMCIFGVLLGVFLIIVYFVDEKNYKKQINDVMSGSKKTTLIADFESGTHAFNDKLIVGQNWLIGNRTGLFIEYSEIRQIYQTIHKTNGIEDGREITVVDENGKRKTLCRLKMRGKSNSELESFFDFLHQRNPNIVIGFK